MISSWPARTRDFSVSALASARSVRLTFNLRAIVAIDSPFFTRYQLSGASSPGLAVASRSRRRSPVPIGTFTS